MTALGPSEQREISNGKHTVSIRESELRRQSWRRAQLLSLWQKRANGKRTEKDVVIFYGEMERALPNLLSHRLGDAYLSLMSDLRGHIEDAARRG